MGDKKYSTLGEWAKDTCDAIRSKDGTSEPIAHGDIPERIKAIPTGSDTSGITATAGDVSENVKFLSKDGVLTQGTMPEIAGEEVTLTKDSPETAIKAGHHDGTGKVKANYSGLADVSGLDAEAANVRSGKTFIGSAGTKETGSMTEYTGNVKTITSNGYKYFDNGYYNGASVYVNVSSSGGTLGSPDISVDSSTGVITATSKVSSSGYISSSSTKSGTLPQSAPTINIIKKSNSTPHKIGYQCVSSGYITADSEKLISATDADSNLVASNIKSGVSILGVTGTYSVDSGEECTIFELSADDYSTYYFAFSDSSVTPATVKRIYVVPSGANIYYDGIAVGFAWEKNGISIVMYKTSSSVYSASVDSSSVSLGTKTITIDIESTGKKWVGDYKAYVYH